MTAILIPRVDGGDREVLAFAATQRLMLVVHVQALLHESGDVAKRRLDALVAAGLLIRERVFRAQPPWYQITRSGLEAIGSELPVPRLDLRYFRHDIGVGWLWLAATLGGSFDGFGKPGRVVSEREMRAYDASLALAEPAGELGESRLRARARGEPPFGVRITGDGQETSLHYPDLLLIVAQGRVVVELQTSSIGRRRLEASLAAYGAEPTISAVVYMVEDRRLGRIIRSTASRLGISQRTYVQPVRVPRR